MRVNIYETVDVSDEQRVQIANLLDSKVSKRQATRDEMKRFVWAYGINWAGTLRENWVEEFGQPATPQDDIAEPSDELEELL